MLPSISSEEIPVQASGNLASSKKWLLQGALLFGLLGLTRWTRPVPAWPPPARISVPHLRDQASAAVRVKPPTQTESRLDLKAVAFSGPGQ
ncbi:hypothetical protein IC235_14585 [Hymenobacter sp. BT664]|uniref:Uncharacterized protein n=1 Tax=Hymenobacter montanus TaxID=2771359 RepID=A0A927GK27_9BACT|nr:hypothetical protein [Hymenobacter montanus]MBD2769118.1 hypothetical protein [Hymenobacter montanus]